MTRLIKTVLLAAAAAGVLAQPVPQTTGAADSLLQPATEQPELPVATPTAAADAPALVESVVPTGTIASPVQTEQPAATTEAAAADDSLVTESAPIDIDSIPFSSLFGSGSGAPASLLSGPSDNAAPSLLAGNNLGAATAQAQQVGGFTANNLRVAVGGSLSAENVPYGNYFPTFDVRPPGISSAATVTGFQSTQPWTQASVNAALGTAAGSSVSTSTSTITSDSDMASSLNVAVQMNGAFLGGAATVEGSFGYTSKSKSSQHRVSGLTFGRLALPSVMLARPDLLQLDDTPGGPLATLQEDVNAFLDTYGTHFIKAKIYGCQATALYTFSCATEEAATDMSAALKANYNGGSFSVGGQVDTTYSTYANSSICSYDGQFQATGLGPFSISPNAGQMMNETLMSGFWNSFGDICGQAGANNETQLLYVLLGNWMEVPAVRTAIQNNATATGILSFYAGLQGPDLNALGMAALFEHNIDLATQNVDNTPSVFTPFAQQGQFDRTGVATGPISPQYWQNLPQAHASIKARRANTTYSAFVNPQSVQQAVASNTPATNLVQDYWAAISQLYNDATATYQYAYTSVTAIARSYNAAGAPTAQIISAPASSPCNIGALNWANIQPAICSWAPVPVGNDNSPSAVAIMAVSNSAQQQPELIMVFRPAGDPNNVYVIGNRVGSVATIDVTSSYNRPPGAGPVRADLSVAYCMPDTSLWATPYNN